MAGVPRLPIRETGVHPDLHKPTHLPPGHRLAGSTPEWCSHCCETNKKTSTSTTINHTQKWQDIDTAGAGVGADTDAGGDEEADTVVEEGDTGEDGDAGAGEGEEGEGILAGDILEGEEEDTRTANSKNSI
ncbi:uncharacterized protein [Notamacropus eugenii]|uniref:uncharacterized protein isoform X2 n=1 Tax=Notamacropus eugenii TaxID=9315 RepID=UPI003B6829B9